VARLVQQVNRQWTGEAVASAAAPRSER
jgi:hypothetical protein